MPMPYNPRARKSRREHEQPECLRDITTSFSYQLSAISFQLSAFCFLVSAFASSVLAES